MEDRMIPEEKSAAVTRGLSEVFGITTIEDIRRVTGGHTSSHVLRIVVQGSPYLLKIIMRTDDPTRHFTSMKAAAAAGLAPHVWYTSVEDRIAITDFVEAVPLPRMDALIRIPALLRTLHALPPFPEVPAWLNTSCMFLLNKGTALDGFLQALRTKNVLPESECKEVLARYEHLAAAYPIHDPDMVSSHNDLFKPDNFLFDGQRVRMVDWETAFLNDRYADLAVVANLIVTNDAEESIFLEGYFGQAPDSYQRARLFLMQQLAHVFYTMSFIFLGPAEHQFSLNDDAPDPREFQGRLWAAQVNFKDNQTRIAHARGHWQQLVRNMEQPRFNEAREIFSARYASTSPC